MENVLSYKDINFYYEDEGERVEILKDFNIDFQKGNFYLLVGPSGSGKTTALALGSGLDSPKSGKILFKGKDIKEIGYTNYRRNNISIVFQSYNLINYLTAKENIIMAMEISGVNDDDKDRKASKILKEVGITEEQGNRSVLKLSGGQQQRIGIARALATNAEIIFADEPTGNLDKKTEEEIINIFLDLAKNHNKCIVMVTHNEGICAKADYVHRLG